MIVFRTNSMLQITKLIVRLSQASSFVETAKTINRCIDQPEASYLRVELAVDFPLNSVCRRSRSDVNRTKKEEDSIDTSTDETDRFMGLRFTAFFLHRPRCPAESRSLECFLRYLVSAYPILIFPANRGYRCCKRSQMNRFTRFHEKYVRVFLYLVAFAGTMEPPSVRSKAFGTRCFLCNAFLKNRTDGRNENICIFSKNGLFNGQSFMAIGGKVVGCLYRSIPFAARNRSNSFVAEEEVERNLFSTRCKLNLSP